MPEIVGTEGGKVGAVVGGDDDAGVSGTGEKGGRR